MIRCKECEYPADDIYDLGEHVYEFHGEHEKSSLECHYCDEKFQSKRNGSQKRGTHRKSYYMLLLFT